MTYSIEIFSYKWFDRNSTMESVIENWTSSILQRSYMINVAVPLGRITTSLIIVKMITITTLCKINRFKYKLKCTCLIIESHKMLN